jgi:hypothetical protein
MNLNYIYSMIYNFLDAYPLITLGIVVFLALLLWKKPGTFVKVIFVILLFVGVIYLGSLLGGEGNQGIQNKYIMSNETKTRIDEETKD